VAGSVRRRLGVQGEGREGVGERSPGKTPPNGGEGEVEAFKMWEGGGGGTHARKLGSKGNGGRRSSPKKNKKISSFFH